MDAENAHAKEKGDSNVRNEPEDQCDKRPEQAKKATAPNPTTINNNSKAAQTEETTAPNQLKQLPGKKEGGEEEEEQEQKQEEKEQEGGDGDEDSETESVEEPTLEEQRHHALLHHHSPDNVETNWDGVAESFDDMELSEELLRGIYNEGYEKPSGIQQRAIVPIIQGRDTVAVSECGSGKTAAFAIASLQTLNPTSRDCQVLILCPTRELAQQVHEVYEALGDYMRTSMHVCVGGTAVRDDITILTSGVQIVIGTPGRVYDMINRGALDLKFLRKFILDEADEMLSRGFINQIYDVFQHVPEEAQVCLFSATLPFDMFRLTTRFMNDPARINVKTPPLSFNNIKQYYVLIEQEDWKFETLCELYNAMSVCQSIVFCASRRKVDWLSSELRKLDFTVSSLHGDMTQQERELVMKEFRSGSSRVMLTTDILARGIDVQHVSLVVQYDLSPTREQYINRCGRSGRYNVKGISVVFITPGQEGFIHDIDEFYKIKLEEMPCDLADIFDF